MVPKPSCAIVFLLLSCPAFAQIGGSGSIEGIVTDSSGAVVANASVTATSATTGVRTTRQTTNAGRYTISPLAAGVYSVTVAAPGFETLVQEKVTVDALSVAALNLSLQV